MSFDVPEDLYYRESHEWIDPDTGRVGITDFAQDELGDVVFVELPDEGDTLSHDEAFGVVESIKAVSDLYANYLTGFSNIKFTVKDCFGQGNKIAKHWIFEGTHTGEFFGIAATGKHVKVEGVTLVRMEGDRIAEEQDFFDNLEFMQQLGLIPR